MNLRIISLVLWIMLVFPAGSKAQITLVNDALGISVYTRVECCDTLFFPYVTGYPAHTMKVFLMGREKEAKVEIYDTKGTVRLRGQFIIGKDTLTKYSMAKRLGRTDDKHYTSVRLLKHLYLLQTGTWFLYDAKGKVSNKQEFVCEFH